MNAGVGHGRRGGIRQGLAVSAVVDPASPQSWGVSNPIGIGLAIANPQSVAFGDPHSDSSGAVAGSGKYLRVRGTDIKVLLVDADATASLQINTELSVRGKILQSASSIDEALDLLATEHFDVVITELRVDGGDGMDLLRVLPQFQPDALAIVVCAQATAREFEEAMRLGAERVMCKPVAIDELDQVVCEAAERSSGFQGNIHGVALVDILQVFHYGRRTATLRVDGGTIHFRDGEVVHAEHGPRAGLAAFTALLSLPKGAMHSMPAMAAPVTIDRPFQSLILDALRRLDEKLGAVGVTTLRSSLPPDFITGGPRLKRETMSPKEIQRMGEIDEACKDIVESVEGAVACGVVDLETGMLLGIHNDAAYTSTLNEVVSAATMDIFRGPNIGRIEQMVREHRGVPEDGSHYFEEILITSRGNFHFAKTLKGGKAVLMLVTKRATNIGMGWAQLKAAIPHVEPLVP